MNIIPILHVVIAGITWGTTGIFVNELINLNLFPKEIAMLRLMFAAIIFIIYLSIKNYKLLKINLRQLPLLILNGLCLLGTSSFYYCAIGKTTVSTAVTLMYTAPILVMCYSVAFLNEQFTVKKLLTVLFAILGCGLVTGIIGNVKFTAQGIMYGLLSGISYAGYSITAKICMKNKVNESTSSLYCFIFATLGAFLFTNPINTIVKTVTNYNILIIAALNGIITTIIPYYFYTKGLKKLTAGTASALATIEPLTATLISIIWYKEKMTIYSFIGILLIVTSVLILSKENDK